MCVCVFALKTEENAGIMALKYFMSGRGEKSCVSDSWSNIVFAERKLVSLFGEFMF